MTSQLIPLAQLTMVHRLAAIDPYREFPEGAAERIMGRPRATLTSPIGGWPISLIIYCVKFKLEACRSSSHEV